MFNLSSRQLSLALAALLSFQMVVAPSIAQQNLLDNPLKAPPLLEARISSSSGILAHDQSPLADRTPLVLVHGIGGTESKRFHWENFLNYIDQRKDFTKLYKVYMFHYDSTRPVPELSRDLQTRLKAFIKENGERQIKVVAYSEGGLLTRNAMQDEYVYTHTHTVLTIATPFHGSPLANPEWLSRQVAQDSPLSLVRLTHKLAYDITGRKYPTFREDFHWDNFDGAIPSEDYLKHNGPKPIVDYSLDGKKNFITYGSFFGVDESNTHLPEVLDLKRPLPEEDPKFILFKKNFLFTLVRKNIAKLPIAAPREEAQPAVATSAPPVVLEEVSLDLSHELPNGSQGLNIAALALAEPEPVVLEAQSVKDLETNLSDLQEPVSMMAYNDGISPISSSLWLGRFTPRFSEIKNPVDRLWVTLKSLKGNKNTRLFAGLDHRNWMDGETRTDSNKLSDLLNPEDEPKTVFEWIIHDLMG